MSADGDVLFFSPLLLDLSNTGSWMENAAFEHIFTSLPDPVQISLGMCPVAAAHTRARAVNAWDAQRHFPHETVLVSRWVHV